MVRRQLGQLEAEILAVLAADEHALAPADIRARLAGEPAYTTVNTVLFRLLEKGLVTRDRDGRHFTYRLMVDESRLVADRMREHLRYASDPPGVLTQFVQTLTSEEEAALRAVLRDGEPGP
ncbi:BlaI/MecI/CopY family transcriptional regulator [Actinomadura flavalba]|uniref:BlaI/MecI/CopY family transcriptional regulator n=1 Tax=Actinomadura flavalba TaxID=1120938 RepID=UPI00036DDEAA|nr:BlaI/MecI/CopY family transcriptional regulator [Actinomadura flavalba]